MRLLAAALLGIGLLPAQSQAGDGYSDIARGIGRAAKRAGVQKVQILPFVSVDGEATPEGRMIASRILSELIDQGKVLVVDGDLPAGLPDPYRTAMGLKAKKNVRPEADAVIMGTHMSGGSSIHVDAQMLRVGDRVILFSANKKLKNEWQGSIAMSDLRPRPPKAQEEAPIAFLPSGPQPERIGSGKDELELNEIDWAEELAPDCRGAEVEVDRLQSSIMDIKARYVARKLKAAGRKAHEQPPSMIRDPALRLQFEDAVQQYLDVGSIPQLSKREIRTLLVVDGKSFEIHRRCAAGRS